MSRVFWVGSLLVAGLFTAAAHCAPADWSLQASIRWDLGAVRDVDFVGDTGLLLAIDGHWDDTDRPGFVFWDPVTKRVARALAADVGGIVVHTASADGSRIAGASPTVARVWDAATGAELIAVERRGGRQPEANAVALSQDGSRVACAVGGGRVEVWDVTTRERLVGVKADPVAGCVAITPDGELLAAAGAKHHRVRTWDVASGGELDVYGGYKRRVRALVFDATGRAMVTGDGAGGVTIWDLAEGRRTHSFPAVDGPVTSVAVSRDQNVVAVASLTGRAVLWDVSVDPPSEVHRMHGDGAAAVALRHDAALFAAASPGIELWPDSAPPPTRRGKGRYAWGGNPRVNASGTRALTTHGNGAVTLWDIERGARVAAFPPPKGPVPRRGQTRAPWRVLTAFTADGAELRIVRDSGLVAVCDAASGEVRRTFAMDLGRRSGSYTQDLTRFADVDAKGTVNVWDLEECRLAGAYVPDPRTHANAMRVCLSPRGRALAATTGGGRVTVWDTRNAQGPWTFGAAGGPPPWIMHVAEDAGAVVLQTGGAVEVWDVAAGVVAQTGEIAHRDGHGRWADATLRAGESRIVVFANPSYRWSSKEPHALQAVTIVPDAPLAFDTDGRLTQDFRAPRDDLAVAYWPAGPGSDGVQSAGRRSRDGRVSMAFVGSRGFDVWRLGSTPGRVSAD